MRIGFFSDVHANLPALQAFLEDSKSENLDELYFLGDAVGYGPDPNECVELIVENAQKCLMGNHDYAALGLMETTCFNNFAEEAIEFTQKTLSPKNRQVMMDFELECFLKDFHLVHATPLKPNHWDYIMTLEDAEDNFPHVKRLVCLIGHSHFPVIVAKENGTMSEIVHDTSVRIEKENKYIINIGSIGQPRDKNPDSCYLIYDSDKREAKLKRVKYDIKATQKRMRDVGLPDYLIQRLEKGR
ncbi:MAG: hypothetical protein GF315_05210 [candidate division Zixibacteria bacterium]|nr:hypothetical protein [candidate division Zixibacteria bacterium]